MQSPHNLPKIPAAIFTALLLFVLLIAFWLRIHDLTVYPPGISNDEATNVIDAFYISQNWNFPQYEDIERPEPLFRVIQAAGIALYGGDVWLVRLTSAFVGLLTIAAVYRTALELLHDVPLSLRRGVAIIAALSLALAMGHIVLSRSLYRGVLQPFFMLMMLTMLLRGLRTGKRRYFIMCGLFLWATLSSYSAAYFVPFAFFPMGLVLLLFHRERWRNWLPNLLLVAVIAGILMIPFALRLLENPDIILGRAGDVVSERTLEIKQIPGLIASIYTAAGDQNAQYNAATAPLIPIIFQPLFVLGLLAIVIRFRQPGAVFVGSLVILVTVPVLLAGEIPHGLRISGAYAVFPIVISAGIAFFVTVVVRFISVPVVAGFLLIIGLILPISQISSLQQTYENYWLSADDWRLWDIYGRRLNHSEWFLRSDRRQFAEWMLKHDAPMLLPVDELTLKATISWLLHAYPEIQSVSANDDLMIPGNTQIVVPWSIATDHIMDETRHYALLYDGKMILLPPLTLETQTALIENIENGETITGRGQLDFLGYSQAVSENLVLNFEQKNPVIGTQILFGDDTMLTGWYGDTVLNPAAETLDIQLTWEAQRRIGHYYHSYVQLQTQNFDRLTGTDQPILRWLYPSSAWQPGVNVPDVHQLILPENLVPGAYRLFTGIYPNGGDTLTGVSAVGEQFENGATIAWLKVPLPEIQIPENNITLIDAQFAESIALRAAQAVYFNDAQIEVTLYWQSLIDRPNFDATVFVHLLDSEGNIITQSDTRPQNGQYPTFIWSEGEIIKTTHLLDVSYNDADAINIRIGMYTLPGAINLPVIHNGENMNSQVVELGLLSGVEMLSPPQ